jgi:hypothetical protein
MQNKYFHIFVILSQTRQCEAQSFQKTKEPCKNDPSTLNVLTYKCIATKTSLWICDHLYECTVKRTCTYFMNLRLTCTLSCVKSSKGHLHRKNDPSTLKCWHINAYAAKTSLCKCDHLYECTAKRTCSYIIIAKISALICAVSCIKPSKFAKVTYRLSTYVYSLRKVTRYHAWVVKLHH